MIESGAMMSPLWSPFLRVGLVGWLLVGFPGCSQETSPADHRAQQIADDEERRQELIDEYAQQVATEEDRLRAEQGDADAQAIMAVAYFNGRGVELDYEEALRWARLAAEQDDPRGQSILAAAYFQGRGVELDHGAAARWARLAAERDDPGAQTILGTLYMNGHGVEQDFVTAYTWLGIAASDDRVAGVQTMLDHLAERWMTSEQLEEAEARVRDWTRGRTR